MKCLGFVTNTVIARNADDRDLHNDSNEIADLALSASTSDHENTTLISEAVNAYNDEACARHAPTSLAQPIAIYTVEHHVVAEKIQHVGGSS